MTRKPIHLFRPFVGVTVAVLGLVASGFAPAGAAPKSAAPFSEWSGTYDTCIDGATCTGTASATGQGAHAVTASVSRPDVTEANEYFHSVAQGAISTRAPVGTDPLRVTYTWRVDSASTAANSTTLGGIAVGRIFATGTLYACRTCSVVDETDGKGALVASTYSAFGPVPPEVVAVPGSLVTHTITVNGPDGGTLPAGTKFTVAGRTRAFAYAGGICNGTCATSPHSGSASAEARLQLVSITMARGAAADEPVLLEI